MRIYADTSVFGGVFDDEFSSPSTEFFKEVREQRFHLVSSAVVEREIMFAPAAVREFFASMLLLAEVAEVTPGVLDLRNAYIQSGVVTEKSKDDATHVALATVSACEVIVSWNFKHIVHFQKVPRYNAVNVLHGHKEIDILSPPQVLDYDDS
jgi:hypothetical protein